MTKLLVKNSKIEKSNSNKALVYNFGIPAFKSETGLKTCPSAGICAKGCYAQQSFYTMKTVKKAYEWRFAQTLKSSFIWQLSDEIELKIKIAKKQNKQLYIRIHDSGDFYSLNYAKDWLVIINQFHEVVFYAYTKQLKMFKSLKLSNSIPSNFIIIYSEGGIFDNLINRKTERHSRVFSSVSELTKAGYVNVSKNDLKATGNNLKVGLVFHGYPKTAWTSEPKKAV